MRPFGPNRAPPPFRGESSFPPYSFRPSCRYPEGRIRPFQPLGQSYWVPDHVAPYCENFADRNQGGISSYPTVPEVQSHSPFWGTNNLTIRGTPPGTPVVPFSFDIPPPPLPPVFCSYNQTTVKNTSSANADTEDQVLKDGSLDSFVKSLGERPVEQSCTDPTLSVSDVSRNIIHFYKMLQNFESCLEKMDHCYMTVGEKEWGELCTKIFTFKAELQNLEKSLILKKADIDVLRLKIKKRRKKRQAAKKRKAQSKSTAEIVEECMKQAKEEHKRKEQMKEMRKKTDLVLSDVRKKKSEAQYYIQLFTSLQKLYTARLNVKKSQGYNTDTDNVNNFEAILTKLKGVWENTLNEYINEENDLNRQLKEAECGTSKEDVNSSAQKMRNFQDWLNILFGDSKQQTDIFYSNMDEFVQIRMGWDKYVVDEQSELGSKIPTGWVVPPEDSSSTWSSYLHK